MVQAACFIAIYMDKILIIDKEKKSTACKIIL